MKTSLYFFVSFCIILLYLTDLIPWVNGIKGYNFILGLQHHDVIPGYVIDYMHGTLLGVTDNDDDDVIFPRNENSQRKRFLYWRRRTIKYILF